MSASIASSGRRYTESKKERDTQTQQQDHNKGHECQGAAVTRHRQHRSGTNKEARKRNVQDTTYDRLHATSSVVRHTTPKP
jgi:hypothetical protein